MNIKSVCESKFWQYPYYFMVLFCSFYSVVFVVDIFDAYNSKIYPFDYPIGAEALGWSYMTIENKIIWGVVNSLFLITAIFLVARLKVVYFYKLLILFFIPLLVIYINDPGNI